MSNLESVVSVSETMSGRGLLTEQTPGVLKESTARSIADAFGLKLPQSVYVPFGRPVPNELPNDGPYVVKIVSKIHTHKSDVGGVRVGMRNRSEVETAISELSNRLGDDLDGFLVDELVGADQELLIGGNIDPIFGPTITVGVGGVLVELLEDVSVRLCPIVERDVHEMLRGLRAYDLLSGYRGKSPVNFDGIVEAVLAIGGEQGLLTTCSDLLVELDVNPLRVDSTHATAVDVRLVRSEKGGFDAEL